MHNIHVIHGSVRHIQPLSILYLRCSGLLVRRLGGGVEASFNSLFEMPGGLPKPGGLQAGDGAFNSLFEMQNGVSAGWTATAVAFNSLFEMQRASIPEPGT